MKLNNHPSGRHFLQLPGPSPVPDRILRALSLPTIDHRGPEFGVLGLGVLAGLQRIFQTSTRSSFTRPRVPAPGKARSPTPCRRATRC